MMEATKEQLEKIDLIRDRTGVSYKEAREALEAAGGEVIEAVIKLEEAREKRRKEFHVAGNKLINKVKELIKRGNVTKIKIKKDDEELITIPVTIGVVGTMIYPPLAVLGMAITMVGKYTLEVEYAKTT